MVAVANLENRIHTLDTQEPPGNRRCIMDTTRRNEADRVTTALRSVFPVFEYAVDLDERVCEVFTTDTRTRPIVTLYHYPYGDISTYAMRIGEAYRTIIEQR